MPAANKFPFRMTSTVANSLTRKNPYQRRKCTERPLNCWALTARLVRRADAMNVKVITLITTIPLSRWTRVIRRAMTVKVTPIHTHRNLTIPIIISQTVIWFILRSFANVVRCKANSSNSHHRHPSPTLHVMIWALTLFYRKSHLGFVNSNEEEKTFIVP